MIAVVEDGCCEDPDGCLLAVVEDLSAPDEKK